MNKILTIIIMVISLILLFWRIYNIPTTMREKSYNNWRDKQITIAENNDAKSRKRGLITNIILSVAACIYYFAISELICEILPALNINRVTEDILAGINGIFLGAEAMLSVVSIIGYSKYYKTGDATAICPPFAMSVFDGVVDLMCYPFILIMFMISMCI